MSESGVIPPPEERNPYTREAGRLVDLDGIPIVIGVDRDAVTIEAAEPVQLTLGAAEEFAQIFVSACWEAGRNAERMASQVVDAVIHDAACMDPDCKGECDG